MKSTTKKLFCLALLLTFLAASCGSAAAAISADDFIDLCANGTLRQIEEAIKAEADVNAQGNYGRTPLMSAARYNNNSEVLNALTKAGADVNAKQEDGWTPLMMASLKNSAEVLNALIQAGAEVNASNNDEETPLNIAVAEREPEIVSLLLAYGADVSENDLELAQKNERLKGAPIIEELKKGVNK